MIKLKRLGHVLIRVSNLSHSIQFYRDLLGFELLEINAENHHKMAFLTLGESGHDIDLLEATDSELLSADRSTLHHIAFQVETFDDLQQAFFHLKDIGVSILKSVDHVNQKSIYIKDPDGTIVEIYYELDESLDMFRKGRNDEDRELIFER